VSKRPDRILGDLVDLPRRGSDMRAFLLLLLAALVAFGADDDWAKVKALKTGAELRVYKKGSAQPISAAFGDLTDDNLIVILKKTETAIPRAQIERIDARPTAGNRVTKDAVAKDTVDPDGSPRSSLSTGYSIGSKPDFQIVYKRTAAPPKK
jgi:hypothetical protein